MQHQDQSGVRAAVWAMAVCLCLLAPGMTRAQEAAASDSTPRTRAMTEEEIAHYAAYKFERSVQVMQAYCQADPAEGPRIVEAFERFRSANPDFVTALGYAQTPAMTAYKSSIKVYEEQRNARYLADLQTIPPASRCKALAKHVAERSFAADLRFQTTVLRALERKAE